jgi:hypothetical protein
MKETNPLETQLRSWQPRRPSARLKRRLFGIPLIPRAGWIVGSLAPAAACLLITGSIYTPRHKVFAVVPLNGFKAGSWSNAAYVVDGYADKQNHWASVTFDSTNRNGSGSTMGSFRH